MQALYYFVHQGKAADWSLNSTPMQQDARVTDAIAVVGEAVAAMRDGDFRPRPPEGGCKPYCAAAAFCWHYATREW